MGQERLSLARYAFATFLVVFTLIGLLSLFSFDPADPPGDAYISAERIVQNVCGPLGAYLAFFLFTYFGLGAYVIMAMAVLWGVVCFSKREITNAAVKATGVLILVTCISAVLAPPIATGLPQPKGMPGLGGIIGAVTANALTGMLAWSGSLIVLLGMIGLALMLATDMLAYELATAGTRKAWDLSKRLFANWRFSRVSDVAGTPVRHRLYSGGKSAAAAGAVRFSSLRPVKLSPKSLLEVESLEDTDREEKEEEAPKKVEAERKDPPILMPVLYKRPEPPKTAPAENGPEPKGQKRPEKPQAASVLDRVNPEFEAGGFSEKGDLYVAPPLDLLEEPELADLTSMEGAVKAKALRLEQGLKEFGIEARVVGIQTGPVVTQFEIELAPGIKVGRVIGLSDDIAMVLKAPSVRIVAPIPGKSTVGIEMPNMDKVAVRLKEIMATADLEKSKEVLPLFLGKDTTGAPLVADLTAMPHLLIAGCTGSGKSVCLNSIILSLIMTNSPRNAKLILVDPKMVELSNFSEIPHLMCPVVTDMKKAPAVFDWAVRKMEERYKMLSRAGVKHIRSYNKLTRDELMQRMGVEKEDEINFPLHMHYIIIIVDELADLMMCAAKEVENSIIRLAQKSRAVGVHIIMATQRPSVDVITGLIKSNLPARISFKVSSKFDSRIVLDQNGADKLLGQGDMLFLPPGTSKLVRAQGTYISDEELRAVTNHIKAQAGTPEFAGDLVQAPSSEGESGERDDLYDEAVRIILDSRRGSVSLLQRRLEIGYSRASRLVDMMAEEGIVGEYKGSQAREVFYTLEEYENMKKQAAPRADQTGDSTAS